ncbi:MAG: hypothetical protein ACK4SF_04035 [Algoriphagus aquaeductus]|uniref:hypothetical protein n=1 Tax=Algoriphagus aquaeductus TaxID=475299 RepID=UPI00391B0677
MDEPEAPKIELADRTPVAKVKAWFEENKTKLRLPERGSNLRTESQKLILPFFEKEPDWDKFHHYYFPDGREVFEVNLENTTKYFPTSMLDSFPIHNPAEVVIQNILFVKRINEERFDPVIARYYPSNTLQKKFFEDMNYQSIDYDWSGIIEMFTYDEHHFVGFRIGEGKVLSNFTLKTYDGEKRKFDANLDLRCHTTYSPVGYQVCAGGTCYTTVERYIAQTSCSGSSGIDNWDYFNYPTGDQNEPRYPTTDGLGGDCSNCEYDPPTIPSPLKKLNCIQLKNTHGGQAKDISTFRNRYYGLTYESIVTERGNVSITGLNSQAGGPLLEYRYIQDPLNPSLIIDMRHMLVIGKLGRAVGESVEFIQYLGQYESAFDDQDYYSNELGYSFFQLYGEAVKRNPTATADYIVSFLANPSNRNTISSPERCKF